MEQATHKTTILLPPSLYSRLTRLARVRGTSMGQLIRSAVEAQYGLVDPDERSAAVAALGALSLPVDTPQAMKAESVPFGQEPVP